MAYLELLSRESLAAAKNPSPPHLSQTPKTPRTYFRKKNKKLNNILIEIHEMLKKYEIVLQMNPY